MDNFTYNVSERVENAMLKINNEFSSFSQACGYMFNVDCTEIDEWNQVKMSGHIGDIFDLVRYLNKI